MTPVIIIVIVALIAAARLTIRARRRGRDGSSGSHPAARGTALITNAMRPLGDVGLVAQREIRERIRGRVLQIGTVLILLVVGAAIVIPAVTHRNARAPRVGIIGTSTAAQQSALTASGAAVGTALTLVPETDRAAADSSLRAGRIDVAVEGTNTIVVKKALTDTDTGTTAQLVRTIARVLGTIAAYEAAGLSATQVQIVGQAKPLSVTSLTPSNPKSKSHPASVITLVLIFLMLSQYSTWILTGVVEEKSSRVVEVLLAAVRPAELLGGKILGIGLVALGQAGLILAFALGLSKAVGSDVLHGTGPLALASALLWLVLGYAFYCWVYAAAGSTVERQDQVQSIAFPLTVPLVIGYIASITAAASGHANTFIEVLAYLPPTAPFAMPTLVSLGQATWWQFTASVVLSILGTIALARVATAIYRRAILRTGRRVRIRELLRGGLTT